MGSDNIYGPNLEHLTYLQSQYGIIVKVYNPIDAASFNPPKEVNYYG